MSDLVNHPPHYKGVSGIECIDAIESMGCGVDFCRANAVKYLWRLGAKGEALEDARKAQWYINRLVKQLEHGLAKHAVAASHLESEMERASKVVALQPSWMRHILEESPKSANDQPRVSTPQKPEGEDAN